MIKGLIKGQVMVCRYVVYFKFDPCTSWILGANI